MQEITDLYFLLSNPNRLALLSELEMENLRLTQLTEKLSVTAQETHKHLVRLTAANLIEKASNGSYKLTSYGRLLLNLMPSFHFLSKNRDYFLTHDISFLPIEFVHRISELAEHEPANHVGRVVGQIERLIRDAENYIYAMSDGCVSNHYEDGTVEYLSSRKISCRSIVSTLNPDREKFGHVNKLGARFEFRELDDVKVATVVDEKSAIVCFSDLNGRIDFNRGFLGTDPSFHKWCRDLFAYYWDKSKRILPSQPQRHATESITAQA